jgi:NADH dehydrogenase [ubiquinone] 1 alpha subcomplex assembly factor 1
MHSPTTEKALFDFRVAASAEEWQTVNDDVMGGVSHSGFSLTSGVAVFRGEVSLENSGGFASVRTQPASLGLAGYDAVLLRAHGDGHRYKFTARVEGEFNGPVYQAPFATKRGHWQEHELPFADFIPTFRGRVQADAPPLDPARIASVGLLIADGQEGPFQLEIEWIKAIAVQPQ